MPEESIIFNPELDDRQLDREVSQVDEQLQEVGQGVPVDFDEQGMDGLGMPEGGLDGMGGGGGGGLGPGAGAGATGLASKLPKPVAGVSVASAVPVALAGGVGLGMLAAMQGASARLQTSASILGQAWNNIWRPLGDKLDQLFVRDMARDIFDATRELGEAIRTGDLLDIGGEVLDLGIEGFKWARWITPLGWSTFVGELVWDNFASDLKWNDWVSGNLDWGDFVDIVEWTTWLTPLAWTAFIGELAWDTFVPNMTADEFVDKMLGGGGGGGGDGSGGTPVMNEDLPFAARGTINNPTPAPGSGGGGGGNDLFMGAYWETVGQFLPTAQAGGRVSRTGVAEVHRGELIADPDRLVDDLASAIGDAGGGGATTDTTAIEDKLDRLHSDMKRLERALDVTLQVGREEIARASAEGKTHDLADSDPTV